MVGPLDLPMHDALAGSIDDGETTEALHLPDLAYQASASIQQTQDLPVKPINLFAQGGEVHPRHLPML